MVNFRFGQVDKDKGEGEEDTTVDRCVTFLEWTQEEEDEVNNLSNV